MAEEQKRGPGRPRKEVTDESQDEAGARFGGRSQEHLDENLRRINEIDERLEDRRPGTLRDRNTGEAFEDNRAIPKDLAKAVNVMTGRAAVTLNPSPHPGLDNPYTTVGGVAYPNPNDQAWVEGDGDEVVILRNYQPFPAKEGDPLPAKLKVGTITRLPRAEAKKLIRQGAAQFTDEDA